MTDIGMLICNKVFKLAAFSHWKCNIYLMTLKNSIVYVQHKVPSLC